MTEFLLDLYVVGASPRSTTALNNLRRICERWLSGRYVLQVIDVLEQPDAAERANIVATPALVKRAPLPVRLIVGDMSRTEVVLSGLGLDGEMNRS